MCKVHAVIAIVAIATLPYITSSIDSTYQSTVRDKYRRFIFNQNNNNMCTFFCPLVCNEGFVKSKTGCFLCQCATSSTSKVTVSPSNTITAQNTQQYSYTAVNGGVFLNNPCNPAVRHCRIQCANGYALGANGCQHCACLSTTSNHISLPVSTVQSITARPLVTQRTTSSTSVSPRVTQRTTSSTSVSHRVTQRTTLSTSARPRVTQRTTSSTLTSTRQTFLPTSKPTSTRPTTRIPTTIDISFNDPCIPSQKTCNKPCNGNYVKGPGGCQYCLCAKEIPPELRTTTKLPISKLNRNATIPHYLDLSPTSEACVIAKVVCNQKCDHGFISHPDDCLFCSCRTQNDDPMNDVPNDFEVVLSNPCVQHTATCGVKCLNGYVIGPRDCQFCSCRH